MGILSTRSNRRVIDLSHPLQARQYLMLLRDDQTSGIRVRENLSIPKGRLGFSFSSNHFGTARSPRHYRAKCRPRHLLRHGSHGGRRLELV